MAKQIKGSQIIEDNSLKNAIDQANALKKAYSELNGVVKKTAEQIANASRGLDNSKAEDVKKLLTLEKQMSKVQGEATTIQKEKARLEERLKNLRSNKIQQNEQLKVLTSEQRKINKQLAREELKLVDAYEKESKQLVKLRRELKNKILTEGKASKSTKQLQKEVLRLDKRLKKADASAGQFQRNVGNYPRIFGRAANGVRSFVTALGVTAGIAGFVRVIGNTLNVIKDFQQGAANLASVLGTTRSQIKPLTDDAKRLGAATSFTVSQITKMQVSFAKLGFNEKEILDATEATLALAAATGTDLDRAAEVAASTLNGFGLGAEETQRVVDVMAKAFSTSSLDMEKFSTAMAAVGPVAKTAGLSIERTTALLGTITDAGIDASTAGTALRNIFLELSKSGKTFEQAMKEIRTSSNQNATAMELFGKRGATVATVLANGADKAEELEKGLNNAGGAAKKMADEQLDTLSGATTRLSSAWEGFILSLEDGDGVIARVLRGAIELTTEFLEKLTALTKSQSQLDRQRLKDNRDILKEKIQQEIIQEGIIALQKRSNEDLKQIVNNEEDNSNIAAYILELRKQGATELENQLFITAKLADGNRDSLETQIKAVKERGKYADESERVAIQQRGSAVAALEEYRTTLLQKASEEELMKLSKLKAADQIGLAKLAIEELQRRKDIGGVEKETEKTSRSRLSTQRKINELAELRKELAEVERLRTNELVNEGETNRYRLLTNQTKELKEQIKAYEDILNGVNDVNEAGKKRAQTIEQEVKATIEPLSDEDQQFLNDSIERTNKLINQNERRREAFQVLTDEVTKMVDKRNEKLDEEIDKQQQLIDASKKREDEIRRLRAAGSLDASQNLAFEQQEQAKALAKQEELNRRKAKNELIVSGLDILNSKIQAGESDATTKSLLEINFFVEALKNLPLFWEGTDYNVSSSLGSPHLQGRDGYILRADGSEMIIGGENSKKIEGMHQDDVVKGALMLKNGVLSSHNSDYTNVTAVPTYAAPDYAVISQQNKQNDKMLNALNKIANKPVSEFDSKIVRDILVFSQKRTSGNSTKTVTRRMR